MAPKILELKPNRQFINSDFDGYKLSLQEILIAKKELDTEVDRRLPNTSQYGFLHAKLFSTQNHLVGERIKDFDIVYFVDKSWKIQKVIHNRSATNEIQITEVFDIPKIRQQKQGDFNVSLKFVDDNLAVISDGSGMLYIVETRCRLESDSWKIIFSGEVLGQDKNFVIQNARIKNNKEMYCLLYGILPGSENERFLNVLNLVTFSKSDDSGWGETCIKELKATGSIYYSMIEPSCNAIYIASEKSLKFTLDSDNPINHGTDDIQVQKIYAWTQTKDDITIKFKLPDNYDTGDISIETTSSDISCKFKNNEFLKGTLFNEIDQGLTSWTVSENALEITLMKVDEGQMWSDLISGDLTGEFVADPSAIAEIHDKLSHLCSDTESTSQMGTTFNSQQVEECDFQDDKCAVFERLCCITHKATHQLNIDSHKVLLTVQQSDTVPAIAFRHDVDAYVWQPMFENEQFLLKHVGTLNAFGYVEASKQQKKFAECAPDLSYSVICESNRHLFIYRQEKPVDSGELRNRATGRHVGFVAQQQVINISNSEIIGICATNYKLFLLTSNTVLVLTM